MDKPAAVSYFLTNTVHIIWSIFECILNTGFGLFQRPLKNISWVKDM